MNGVGIGVIMEILEEKYVKTRKVHVCWGCGIEQPVGSDMRYITNVDARLFIHTYWCETCEMVINNLDYWEKEDGFDLGEIRENYLEEWVARGGIATQT